MKRKFRKFGIAFLGLVIALSLTGAGFAHWSDAAKIRGTMQMNSLTLAFDWVEPPTCQEYWFDAEAGKLVLGEYLGKDVGNCTASYSDNVTDVHTNKPGYKTLNIEVNNAYPQYYVYTVFKLHNIGTVPLNIVAYNISGEKRDDTGAVVYDLLWHDPEGDWIGSLWEDVDRSGNVTAGDLEVINLELVDALPFQIDPCKTEKQEIDIDFKQAAEECHSYTIHVDIIAIQWNKAYLR